MVAAGEGHLDCVRLLAGAEGGVADREGRTALWHTMRGIDERHRECFGVLNQIEGERKTREYEAVQEVYGECRCGGAGDLFEAAQRGCCRCSIAHLGEAGRKKDGLTSLMVAAREGHTGCVRILT